MNKYYEYLKFVKTKIETYLNEIFKVYGNELLLHLEEYNLLTNPYNCIETSTATGFIMEEFIVSKLEIYTKNHNEIDEIKIKRLKKSTINSSYDCYAIYNDIYIMINIKIQKQSSQNNAVAAINILHNDYVITNPEEEKAYLILKTYYNFGKSKIDNQRKIIIKKINSYYLEEIDFSTGHKQDHRNWSTNFNAKSGRLQISNNWKNSHLSNEQNISYNNTKQFISNIYNQSQNQ